MRTDSAAPTVTRQLFLNQLWETVGFAAKAVFTIGLTPWMIKIWGAHDYGDFALASSTYVILSIADLGIRARTRLALCSNDAEDRSRWLDILTQGASTFATVGLFAILSSFALSYSGLLQHLFGISRYDNLLIPLTTVMSVLVMLSGLLLEPLVALGHIGQLKLMAALGWFLAVPAVGLVLTLHGSVTSAAVVWLGCLFLTNFVLLLLNLHLFRDACGVFPARLHFHGFAAVLKDSFWYNLCTASWSVKTYGSTFLVAAVNGPVSAGVFYILLRLSEIVGGLGAISSDVSLGGLAQVRDPEEERLSFASSYSWAVILCSHIALVIVFSARDFLHLWLRTRSPLPPLIGLVVVALGLSSAFNRTATYAAMALGKAKVAARWGLIEALSFLGIVAAVAAQGASLFLQLALASTSVLALLPLARAVSSRLSVSPAQTWLRPFRLVVPYLLLSAVLQAVAYAGGSAALKISASAAGVVICLLNLLLFAKKSPYIPGSRVSHPISPAAPLLCSTR